MGTKNRKNTSFNFLLALIIGLGLVLISVGLFSFLNGNNQEVVSVESNVMTNQSSEITEDATNIPASETAPAIPTETKLLISTEVVATIIEPTATLSPTITATIEPTNTATSLPPTPIPATPTLEPTIELIPTVTPEYVDLNVPRLNLREGPATSFSSIKILTPQDGLLKVLSQDKALGWTEVELANGVTGWVSADFIGSKTSATNGDVKVVSNAETAPILNITQKPLSSEPSVVTDLKSTEEPTIESNLVTIDEMTIAPNAWKAEYFNNRVFRGDPVVIAQIQDIDFDWGLESPINGIKKDRFSIRFTKHINVVSEDLFIFNLIADHGAIVYIDDYKLIDGLNKQTGKLLTEEIRLSAGPHKIGVEYVEVTGNAYINFNFIASEQQKAELVISQENWQGEYFKNTQFSGKPLTQEDQAINFDWGEMGPDILDGRPNRYSIRWSKNINVANTDTYIFNVIADHGATVYVDDFKLIDGSSKQTGKLLSEEIRLSSGPHKIIVEYVEVTRDAYINFDFIALENYKAKLLASPEMWHGEYFKNTKYAGIPFIQKDVEINFDWGVSGPQILDNRPNSFTVRWSKNIYKQSSGIHVFELSANDSANVFVNGNKIYESTNESSNKRVRFESFLESGIHKIEVEYFENRGDASIYFSEQSENQFITNIQASIQTWRGEYYNNNTLNGSPIFVDYTNNISFNWNGNSPNPSKITRKLFSVNWSKNIFQSTPQSYWILIETNDGVLLKNNGVTLIDELDGTNGELILEKINFSQGLNELVLQYTKKADPGAIEFRLLTDDQYNDYIRNSPWRGQYYRTLNINARPAFVAKHDNINFDWGLGSPDPLPIDRFAARWQKTIFVENSDIYRFSLNGDDDFKMFLDGNEVVDAYNPVRLKAQELELFDLYLTAGFHDLVIEYRDLADEAFFKFDYFPMDGSAPDRRRELSPIKNASQTEPIDIPLLITLDFPETPHVEWDVESFETELELVRDSFRSFQHDFSPILREEIERGVGRDDQCRSMLGLVWLWVKQSPYYENVPPEWQSLHLEYRAMIRDAYYQTNPVRRICPWVRDEPETRRNRFSTIEYFDNAYPRIEQMVIETYTLRQ